MLDIRQYINIHLFIYIPVELFYSFDPVLCCERPGTGQSEDQVLRGLLGLLGSAFGLPWGKKHLFLVVSTIATSTI